MLGLKNISVSKISTSVLLGLLILLPLLLLPLGASPLESTKQVLLMVATSILVILFGIHIAQKHWFHLPLHPFLLPLAGIGLSVLISTLIASPYPQTIFLGMSGSLIAFVTIVLLGGWISSNEAHKHLPMVLSVAGALVSVLAVLDAFGFGSAIFYTYVLRLPSQELLGFSPTGSLFMVGQFCAVAFTMGLVALFTSHKKTVNPLFLLTIGLNLLGVVLAIWYSLPGKETTPILLPWTTNWSITVDTLRSARTAVFGVGPDNFVDAFTKFRPATMNATTLWNVEFSQAQSLPFSVLTTQGLFGLLTWGALVVAILKNAKKMYSVSPALTAGVIVLLVTQFLFPPTTLMFGLLAIILALLIAATNTLYSSLALTPLTVHVLAPGEQTYQSHKKYSMIVSFMLVGIIMLAAVAIGYRAATAAIAEYFTFQAALASNKGDAIKLYQLQQNAIIFNPYNSSYHRAYASTNMLIAQALANKTEPTEEDKQRATILVEQAIKEARLATALSPNRALNWEALGDIYTNLIGTAAGAETWAAEVYRQAILSSPTNPILYIKLGNVFASQKNYSVAIQLYDQAAQLKPDLVSPYYSAATLLKETKDLSSAKAAYEQTLSILEQTSGTSTEEYAEVMKEIEALQLQIEESGDKQTEASSSSPISITEPTLQNPNSDLDSSEQLELNDSTRELLNDIP